MSSVNIERFNRYEEHIMIENEIRIYTNPEENSVYSIPTDAMEILIQNIVLPCSEEEILPLFERFGPVYKFYLLTDSSNLGCTCASLTYYLEKSALVAIDVMKNFVRKGMTMYVHKSEEKFSILAHNIAPQVSDRAIEKQLTSLFSKAECVTVSRQQNDENGNPTLCAAVIEFPNLTRAIAAMKYGSLILWGKTVTLEWDNPERRSYLTANEVSSKIKIRV